MDREVPRHRAILTERQQWLAFFFCFLKSIIKGASASRDLLIIILLEMYVDQLHKQRLG